ncbi:MAG: vWA domain-containing protein, partial [Candidatus Entotheonellia bacterium]
LPGEKGMALDLFILLDQSGSRKTTDPQGLRIAASRYLIRNLAQRSDQDSKHRLGLVHFGTAAPASLAVPLSEVSQQENDAGVQRLLAGLKPLSLGDTNFVAALKAAHEGFRASQTFSLKRKAAIVIFTDGEPDDPRKLTMEAYFREIREFLDASLRPNGYEVYVVGIEDVKRTWTKSIPHWRKLLSPVRVLQLEQMDQLPEKFNDIVRQLFEIPSMRPDVVTAREQEFDVQPYLEKLEFHIFPLGTGLKLSILEPGKKPLVAGDRVQIKHYETYDIITVLSPPYGRWKYQILEGSGRVEIYRNALPIRLRLINPGDVHPMNKPLRLAAGFVKATGEEVASVPEYPLKLTAKIVLPSGGEHDVTLYGIGEGIFFADGSVDPAMAGTYRIILTAHGGDVYRFSREKTIAVSPLPYIAVEDPTDGAVALLRSPLPVRVRLLQGGKPLVARDQFLNHPGALMLAQFVRAPAGTHPDSFWLEPVPDDATSGSFWGSLPLPTLDEGWYILKVRLAGQLRTGVGEVQDSTEVKFFLKQPPCAAICWAKRAGKGIALVVVALIISGGIWTGALPRMQGQLFIYPSGEEGGVPLAQPQLRGKKARIIRVPGGSGYESRWIWVNRLRKGANLRVRSREGWKVRARTLALNGTTRVGKFVIKYM